MDQQHDNSKQYCDETLQQIKALFARTKVSLISWVAGIVMSGLAMLIIIIMAARVASNSGV